MDESTTSARTKVLIVDDHRLFNNGLKATLRDEPAIEVVGQVFSSRDTPHAVFQHAPDILLMDFNMPDVNGLEMTRQLVKSFPEIRILILSMYGEQRYIDDFRKAGAKGYVFKTIEVEELMAAIEAVLSGNTYFLSKLETKVKTDHHAEDGFMKKFKLTAREIEVIEHIREGLTNQQIADVMYVSYYTVETHRRNIHFKLGIKSTAELIRFMDENK